MSQYIQAQLLAAVQVVLQQLIIFAAIKEKQSIPKHIISVVALMVTYELVNVFFHPLSYAMMVIWVLLLILSYFVVFRQPVFNSILLGVSQFVLSIGIEYFFVLFFALLGAGLLEYLYSNLVLFRCVLTVFLILLYIATLRIRSVFLPFHTPFKQKVTWLVYFLYLLSFTLPKILRIEQNQLILSTGTEFLDLLLFIAFFIFNATYINSSNKMNDISQRLEIQQLYTQTLEKSLTNLRGFKHDFSNILHTISGLAITCDAKPLMDYMHSINTAFLNTCTSDIVNTTLKDTPVLYGIILSKLSLAEINGIEFNIHITNTIDLKYCNPVDFSRIVGILLDNALEAAEASPEKHVELIVNANLGRQELCIRNTCATTVNIDVISQENFTTKEGHTGIGLSTVASLIKKYRKKGFATELRTACQTGWFSQTLII